MNALRSLLAIVLVAAPGPILAEDAAVIPLSDDSRKQIALLGDGVVGKALPAHPISDPEAYLSLGPGTWEFKIVAGDGEGKTQKETYTKVGDGSWKRAIGDEYVEFIAIQSDRSNTRTAETALQVGYRCAFEPGIRELSGIKPGESVAIDSKLRVFKDDAPGEVKYTGTMKGTLTYEGAYRLTVPAGSFDTVLLKTDLEIHAGPAKVHDTQHTFFARGVGKVAEIEAQRIAAILLYHSHSDTAKILLKHPTSR